MKRVLPLLFLVLLAACGGLSQPFGKSGAGAPATVSSITAPPWEAMVAAGPGAANDIDLETLNGPTAPPPDVMAAEAPAEPAEPAKPLNTNKGPEIKAVAVVPVVGATGSGNGELTKAMRETLTKAGWTVLAKPAKNALTIVGHVAMAQATGPTQTVSLNWAVQTPDGKSLGDVKQANDVPAGSLDKGWGESAGFAAEAAATGIFELINKLR